jgi:phospholipase/carboxylesterase
MLAGSEIFPKNKITPKKLVLFLHGVGSNGADVASICHILNNCLPDTMFLCPNAPFAYDMGMGDFQWFSLQDRTESILLEGINKALPIANEYINYHLENLKLEDKDLAIMGFSQGCMMSLHLGLRRPNPPACVIGFSGALIGTNYLEKHIKSKPPVILTHGIEDQIVPVQLMKLSARNLIKLGVDVESYSIPGLAHSIDEECLKIAISYLKKYLI